MKNQIFTATAPDGQQYTAGNINELVSLLKLSGMTPPAGMTDAAALNFWVKENLIKLATTAGPEAQAPAPAQETRPRHGAQDTTQEPTPGPCPIPTAQEPTPAPLPPPPPPVRQEPEPRKPQSTGNPADLLQQFIASIQTPAPALDPAQVREIVKDELNRQEPRQVSISVNNAPAVTFDAVHPNFEMLVKNCAARVSSYLTGPKGTGKSTAARQVAQLLNLPFYIQPCSAQTAKHEFFGYQQAAGEFVPSLFFKAYTEGGVFLIDEMDSANENLLISLNDAIGSDSAAFPNGMHAKHPDFICIGAGNTLGSGASKSYTGRRPLDAASLDRFVFILWPIDEALEMKISPNQEFTKWVQKARAACVASGIEPLSPRASIYGGKLLAAGHSLEDVKNMVFFNKLTGPERQTLKNI